MSLPPECCGLHPSPFAASAHSPREPGVPLAHDTFKLPTNPGPAICGRMHLTSDRMCGRGVHLGAGTGAFASLSHLRPFWPVSPKDRDLLRLATYPGACCPCRMNGCVHPWCLQQHSSSAGPSRCHTGTAGMLTLMSFLDITFWWTRTGSSLCLACALPSPLPSTSS